MSTKGEYINPTCGCDIANGAIHYCPKHQAAFDMYEALKLYQSHQEGITGHWCWRCALAINEALVKAKPNS